MTCEYIHIPSLSEPDDQSWACANEATHTGCDGLQCAEHRCRCSRPLPGVAQPPAEVTQWRELVPAWLEVVP